MPQNTFKYCLLTCVAVMVLGCQVVKKNYHNTCLHYNKYFLANEKMKELESELWKNHKDDYNNVLKVYPDCDTNKSKSIRAQAEECYKKASLGIDWHGGTYWVPTSWNGESRWADNAFILIGKARLYLNESKNAKETFKYVNTRTKDENDRHEALIWLANTFTHFNEFFNAAEVLNQLSEEKLTNKNKREYYLAKTYFHTKVGELTYANKYVQKAIPLTSRWIYKRDKRARLHFIAAQIYQMYGKDSSAYLNYQKTIKNNPSYELGFYARLYAAQVSSTQSGKQDKKIQRYFKKMLKDPKNKEYNDKVYYEMANYELKYKRYAKAVEYLKKSIKVETSSGPYQKGYSYLKLGELNYEHFKNYQAAKYYYDSALISLPKDHKDYKKIFKRKNILDEFVKHYDVIVLEDSLQKLGKLDSLALENKLASIIDADYKQQKDVFLAEKKAAKIKAEKEANATEQLNGGANFLTNNDPKANWYFYNFSNVQNGKLEFKKSWGNRILEDHWRRSIKEKIEQSLEELPVKDSTLNTVSADPNLPKPDKDGFVGKRLERSDLIKNIPKTKEALASSNLKIIEAMYNLGKIYHFKLEEVENAASYYLDINDRFRGNVHEAEILYLLYLLYKDKDKIKSETFKEKLLKEHPTNDFAKTLVDPNWRIKENEEYSKYESQYKHAFKAFEARNFKEADSLAKEILKLSPLSPFKYKLELISVLSTAKINSIYQYRDALLEFNKNNKDSSLIEYSKSLLNQCEERIKLKEEIERKWKEKLDSASQNKVLNDSSQTNDSLNGSKGKAEPEQLDTLNKNDGISVSESKSSSPITPDLPTPDREGNATQEMDLDNYKNNLPTEQDGLQNPAKTP